MWHLWGRSPEAYRGIIDEVIRERNYFIRHIICGSAHEIVNLKRWEVDMRQSRATKPLKTRARRQEQEWIANQEIRKNKIDVHAHLHSPDIFHALEKIAGKAKPPLAGPIFRAHKTAIAMQEFALRDRLAWMSKNGIEKAVFSFPNAIFWIRPDQTKERKEFSQWLNDYFAMSHGEYTDRAFFFADVALDVGDITFSIKELHRAIQTLKLSGINLPTNLRGKLLTDPLFEEFFTHVEKLGIPIFIHPESPYGQELMRAYFGVPIVGFPNDQALMITYMILSGWLDRHPDIKIITTHLGGGIPYFHSRLDCMVITKSYDPVVTGGTNLTKRPSEYLKNFYYDTAMGSSLSLKYLIDLLGGSDRIMFGSDHPYIECAEAKTINYISETPLTVDDRDNIYFKNTERLFGFSHG